MAKFCERGVAVADLRLENPRQKMPICKVQHGICQAVPPIGSCSERNAQGCVCLSISTSMSIQHLPFSLQTSIVPRNSFWNVSVNDQVDQHLK